jgi:DNA helicase II / ATP-dependent DNA helicase PcrA
VAITRARQSLEISYSNFTKKFGVVEARVSSRFLDEIADEFWANKESSPIYGARTPESPPQAKNADVRTEKKESKLGSEKSTVFREGQKVRHKVYGDGKIVKLSGSGDNLKADVRFGQFVEKKFLLAYTPLEIMS